MIKSTSDNHLPAAYALGKMFYAAGREYNPYQPDTEAYTDFYRGRLDAEEEDKLAAEIGSWDTQPENFHRFKTAGTVTGRINPHCSRTQTNRDSE